MLPNQPPTSVDSTSLLAELQRLSTLDDLGDVRQALDRLASDRKVSDRSVSDGVSPTEQSIELVERPADSPLVANQLAQIRAARTLDRARYYIVRLIKSLTKMRTPPSSDINLNRWQEYGDLLTDSLWLIKRRNGTGAHRASYWGNFIPQIPNQLIRRYTRSGEWVLDPFVGLGTTLMETQRLGRNAIGVELQPEVAERARAVVGSEPNPTGVAREVLVGDSASFDFSAALAGLGQRSAQLVILHPPYHDIIRFSADPRDLSNAESVESFLAGLGQVIANAASVLERGRYLALVIGDKYERGEWVPLGFRAMEEALRRGFALKSIVIKNFDETLGKRQQTALWRYRALAGEFYVFKHEYIFVLRKR